MNFDVELDCKGLSCPMPVLKTKKQLDTMQVGQVLKMISTDAGSKSDVSALVKRTGHELVNVQEAGREFTFFIKKMK
ncbi:MAG TPA: sulfurtransferase TusA family protein [Thermodesulfovibrionia bacterium]|nr:sulfurtransferase TusA family protein [Thermodesulfovibrionia bacterium]